MAFFSPIVCDWPRERILFDGSHALVVDKPEGLPVHGGAPGWDDVVTRLGHWLAAQGRDGYLAVHHRLDSDSSGVLFFGRDTADNAQIAEAMEAHRARRRYLAVVTDPGLPQRFEWRDQLDTPTDGGPTRVCAEGGVSAVARGQVLERSEGRALVELFPETGRRHQLRVQLASRGAPILGDRMYRGAPASRMLLHSASFALEVLGLEVEAPVPPEFEEVGGRGLQGERALTHALKARSWLRAPLARRTDCYRLINAAGDGLPGVVVDRYGDHAVLELSTPEALERRSELVEAVVALEPLGIYVKCRQRRDLRHADVEALAPSLADWGVSAPDEQEITEDGVKYGASHGDGWDVGLYLDQRENRRRLQSGAAGLRVLNLFCYTGSFSLAAALGGARRTVSVDLSARALERARRNFELNELVAGGAHAFVRADARQFLAAAVTKPERFERIILDPPSFSTGKAGVFRLADEWDAMLEACCKLLTDDGQLLVISHERGVPPDLLRKRVHRAVDRAKRELASLREGVSGGDCPSRDGTPFPSRSLWATLGSAPKIADKSKRQGRRGKSR